MAEEIAFENGRIFNLEGLVTLTLSLDWVILHTVVHHSSTCTFLLMRRIAYIAYLQRSTDMCERQLGLYWL